MTWQNGTVNTFLKPLGYIMVVSTFDKSMEAHQNYVAYLF